MSTSALSTLLFTNIAKRCLSVASKQSINSFHNQHFSNAIRVNSYSTIADDTKVAKCDELRIRSANATDFDRMLNFLLAEFLPEEPLSRSISLYKDVAGGTSICTYLINKSLKYPLTAVVENRNNGQLAAVRLMSIWQRTDVENESESDELASLASSSPGAVAVINLLNAMKHDFWQLVPPNVNRVVRREITSVSRAYRRMGIANGLVHWRLDDRRLRDEMHVDGIVSEASSLANQQLLLHNGYRVLKTIMHEDYRDKESGRRIFNCHDGTDRMALCFRAIGNK